MEIEVGAGAAPAGGAGAAASGYSVVASGSFGTVIKPALPNTIEDVETMFPSNVTKIFFREANLQQTLGKARNISKFMNAPFQNSANHGHAVYPYTKGYAFRNLPANLKESVGSVFRSTGHRIPKNDDPLQLLRMPNLGIDIFALNDSPEAIAQLRNVPFYQLYYQFFKIYAQTHSLNRHRFIHCDIRDTNVMIKPDTGEINIIDFDMLQTFDECHSNLGNGKTVKYQHPPECLMYGNYKDVENPGITEDLRVLVFSNKKSRVTPDYYCPKLKKVYETYCTHAPMYFDVVFHNYDVSLTDLEMSDGILQSANGNKMDQLLQWANGNNVRYIRRQTQSGVSSVFYKRVLPTIDNYGLSLTMLQMLGLVYPNIVRYGKELEALMLRNQYTDDIKNKYIHAFISELRPLISNNGGLYTDEQLNQIAYTLLNLSYILNQASSLELERRPTTLHMIVEIGNDASDLANVLLNEDEARAAITNIETVFLTVNPKGGIKREIAAAPVGGAGAAAPVGGAEKSNQGGGSRSGKRRPITCRRKRKFNTRNKRQWARTHKH